MTARVQFLLNDQLATAPASGQLVLDYLRYERRLVGTKEGCKEGDCGACVVLVGELRQDALIRYRPVTSCLMPMAELHGRHLVTIEGLDLGTPSIVQGAICDAGASQCGFCTPGIVVSLTGWLLDDDSERDRDGVRRALGGHLCRCTGYRSLQQAGLAAAEHIGHADDVDALVEQGHLPRYFSAVPDRLRRLGDDTRSATADDDSSTAEEPPIRVAGGTDLYVQRGEELSGRPISSLLLRDDLRGIERRNGHLRVGAMTSFEDFAASPLARQLMPSLPQAMELIASWQIRNRATLGGNIVNASPIGDMTVLLLAMGGELVLEALDGARRQTPMRTFFRGYKQLAKEADEMVVEILLPVAEPADGRRVLVDFEKVSKRRSLDIATVNSALRLVLDGDTITSAGLATGGVAPVPLWLQDAVDELTGRSVAADDLVETLLSAIDRTQAAIAPISDVRGSAEYKRLLSRQLLIGHFTTLFADRLLVEQLYSTFLPEAQHAASRR